MQAEKFDVHETGHNRRNCERNIDQGNEEILPDEIEPRDGPTGGDTKGHVEGHSDGSNEQRQTQRRQHISFANRINIYTPSMSEGLRKDRNQREYQEQSDKE